jgi:nucleotide-binding universal stress UspA family protein
MFRRILVPLDGSSLAEEAIGMAAAIARAAGADIDLLMVHEPLLTPLDTPDWSERQIVSEEKYLRGIAEELTSGAGVKTHETLLRGRAAELIGLRAADSGADLIVMTSHGRTGWSRAWIGSVADAVVRASGVPVLLLRPNELRRDRRSVRRPPRRILLPLDGSPAALEILAPAGALALRWNARIDLLRVVAPVPLILQDMALPFLVAADVIDSEATEEVVRQATQELERDAATLRATGVEVGRQSVIVSPLTAQAIADFARTQESEMIAMATHGRGRSRLVIGSVAEKVRRATDVPVLLLRPRFARAAQPLMTERGVADQLPALAGTAAGGSE